MSSLVKIVALSQQTKYQKHMDQ